MTRKKQVTIRQYNNPTRHPTGYHDRFMVFDFEVGDYIFEGWGSSKPNGWHPRSSKPWNKVYGWIAPGIYHLKCIMHYRYGKCLIINKGGVIGTRNERKKGRYMTGVFIHRLGTGKNPNWRGSAGCPGLQGDKWKAFISNFRLFEEATLRVE